MGTNFPGWTMARVRELQSKGLVAAAIFEENKSTPQGKLVAKHFKRKSKEKEFISKNLFVWAQHNLLKLYQEYIFDETGEKNYRFDWCFPEIKLAIEYEGIFSEKSGHTTITGYTKDVRKYNLATLQGWTKISVTAADYETFMDHVKKYYATYLHKRRLDAGIH